MRYFNTAGPCRPEDNYMLPALWRLPEVRELIDQGAYFAIHTPRPVGKTTTMMQLARELTAEGRYTALLVSMEVGAVFNDDPGAAELKEISSLRFLAIHGTRITGAGTAQLRQAMPGCKIIM